MSRGVQLKRDLIGADFAEQEAAQSGAGQFIIVRTKEFADSLVGLDASGKAKLAADIESDWDTAFAANKGLKLPERVEKTVKSVCAKYKLSYYKGSGGKLDKVDTSK